MKGGLLLSSQMQRGLGGKAELQEYNTQAAEDRRHESSRLLIGVPPEPEPVVMKCVNSVSIEAL